MRHFLFFISFIVFLSCKNKTKPPIDYTGFVDRQIVLDSGLGIVSLKLPARFDTFYKWIDFAPGDSYGWSYYRYADKKYALVKDCKGDCYNIYNKDSICQFSLKTIRFNFQRSNWEIEDFKKHLAKNILLPIEKDGFDETVKAYFLDSLKINNRLFSICFFDMKDKLLSRKPKMDEEIKTRSRFVIRAQTLLKDSLCLEFRAEHIAKDTIGFKENMYKTIQSIQIKEQP